MMHTGNIKDTRFDYTTLTHGDNIHLALKQVSKVASSM